MVKETTKGIGFSQSKKENDNLVKGLMISKIGVSAKKVDGKGALNASVMEKKQCQVGEEINGNLRSVMSRPLLERELDLVLDPGHVELEPRIVLEIGSGSRGPGPKHRRKKCFGEIYESIQISCVPSYYSALAQSFRNPNLSLHQNITHVSNSWSGSRSMKSQDSLLGEDSITDCNVNQGNRRILILENSVPSLVWKSIKELGLEGDEDDQVFEGIIRELEDKDQNNTGRGKEHSSRGP